MELAGKKALVTGGAVRIGRAICERLAEAGCDIVIQYNHSGDEAHALREGLAEKGVRSLAIQANLMDMGAVSRLVPDASEQMGGLDILINNAAVFNKTSLLDSPPDTVQAELTVNALAPIELMRTFGKLRGETPHGGWPTARIVNLLDRRVAGVEAGALPYTLSKKMLRDATQAAARDLGPGISVNAVAPGPILPPPGEGDDYLSEKAGPMVFGRCPTPSDIAHAVLFLLQADGMTGQVIYVDSGQHLL